MDLVSGNLLHFSDISGEDLLEIDISVNKTLEVLNSQLLMVYCQLSEDFHRLALFLKAWNKKNFTDKMTRLNSYTMSLMLLAFMQYEQLLPSLQAQRSDRLVISYYSQTKSFNYNATADVTFERDPDALKLDLPRKSLGETLYRFFRFYGQIFNSEVFAIDIRSGQTPFPLRKDVLTEMSEKFSKVPQVLGQPLLKANH